MSANPRGTGTARPSQLAGSMPVRRLTYTGCTFASLGFVCDENCAVETSRQQTAVPLMRGFYDTIGYVLGHETD